jgi:hypothetical protein
VAGLHLKYFANITSFILELLAQVNFVIDLPKPSQLFIVPLFSAVQACFFSDFLKSLSSFVKIGSVQEESS